jgi:hypothetical protein
MRCFQYTLSFTLPPILLPQGLNIYLDKPPMPSTITRTAKPCNYVCSIENSNNHIHENVWHNTAYRQHPYNVISLPIAQGNDCNKSKYRNILNSFPMKQDIKSVQHIIISKKTSLDNLIEQKGHYLFQSKSNSFYAQLLRESTVKFDWRTTFWFFQSSFTSS